MDDVASLASLAELKAAVEAYEGCPLKPYATRAVFGDGNPFADIMLIGEAPGAQEDIQGKPFVGRSGKLLDQMLEAIGLNRAESVYITNVTFWRPPDNRNPTPAELESCRPFVNKHIALVKPKILVLVGGVPTKHMLQTPTGIMKLRGQWQQLQVPGVKEPIPTLPVFHPAYLLRNPPAKREAWADMQALRTKGEQLGVEFGPLEKRD
jgi:DNA polymerase